MRACLDGAPRIRTGDFYMDQSSVLSERLLQLMRRINTIHKYKFRRELPKPLSTRRSKESRCSPKLPGTLEGYTSILPSAACGCTFLRAPAGPKYFSSKLLLLISNVPRSKNRNEAHTQSALGHLSPHRFGRKSPDIDLHGRTFSNEPP